MAHGEHKGRSGVANDEPRHVGPGDALILCACGGGPAAPSPADTGDGITIFADPQFRGSLHDPARRRRRPRRSRRGCSKGDRECVIDRKGSASEALGQILTSSASTGFIGTEKSAVRWSFEGAIPACSDRMTKHRATYVRQASLPILSRGSHRFPPSNHRSTGTRVVEPSPLHCQRHGRHWTADGAEPLKIGQRDEMVHCRHKRTRGVPRLCGCVAGSGRCRD